MKKQERSFKKAYFKNVDQVIKDCLELGGTLEEVISYLIDIKIII